MDGVWKCTRKQGIRLPEILHWRCGLTSQRAKQNLNKLKLDLAQAHHQQACNEDNATIQREYLISTMIFQVVIIRAL